MLSTGKAHCRMDTSLSIWGLFIFMGYVRSELGYFAQSLSGWAIHIASGINGMSLRTGEFFFHSLQNAVTQRRLRPFLWLHWHSTLPNLAVAPEQRCFCRQRKNARWKYRRKKVFPSAVILTWLLGLIKRLWHFLWPFKWSVVHWNTQESLFFVKVMLEGSC